MQQCNSGFYSSQASVKLIRYRPHIL